MPNGTSYVITRKRLNAIEKGYTSLYYLYIDESGDEADYVNNPTRIDGSSRFFTLAGIIVDNVAKEQFHTGLKIILSDYFSSLALPACFKLHYYEVRRRQRHPYSTLNKQDSFELANDVFDYINKIDCKLLSVTIDLDKHCKKYSEPVNPRAYTLLLMLERFQYFLESQDACGEVIYEEFNAKLRSKAELIHKKLYANNNFPKPTSLRNMDATVKHGNPSQEPVLQFADFFAYTPWIRSTTNGDKSARWNSIKHKYYNLDHSVKSRRGNVEM